MVDRTGPAHLVSNDVSSMVSDNPINGTGLLYAPHFPYDALSNEEVKQSRPLPGKRTIDFLYLVNGPH